MRRADQRSVLFAAGALLITGMAPITALCAESVRSIFALRTLPRSALPPAACDDKTDNSVQCCVTVLGYRDYGDGGGGQFCNRPGFPPVADNAGTIIKPNFLLNTQPGRWLRTTDGTYNVRWFGAQGNTNLHSASSHATGASGSDAAAILAAIRVAEAGGGGRVLLPSGVYCLDPKDSLTIHGSNVTLEGEGDSSVVYVPIWGSGSRDDSDFDTLRVPIQAHIQIGNATKNIENVHPRRFRFLGTLGADSAPPPLFWNATQIGVVSSASNATFVVNASGFSEMHVEKVGGAAFAFNGGQNSGSQQSTNNYVINNVVYDIAYEAVNPWSGGHANTVVCNNRIDGTRSIAIEWSSMRALICNNVITNARQGAISITQAPEHVGWTIVSGNTITNVGNMTDGSVAPAIQLGQSYPAFRVKISDNVIQNSYGSATQTYSGVDIAIDNNVIDAFGIAGSQRVTQTSGINATNITGMAKVTGNYVRCKQSDPPPVCTFGVTAGGGNAEDTIVDGNTVRGVTEQGGTAFVLPSSVGGQGAGRSGPGGRLAPPNGPQRGFGSYVGRNQDLDNGAIAGPRSWTNQVNLPALLPDPPPSTGRYSVGGSDVWEVAANQPAEILDLTDPSPGRLVTLLCDGPSAITIRNAGKFFLASDFISVPNRTQTLTLTFRPGLGWIEIFRSMNNR